MWKIPLSTDRTKRLATIDGLNEKFGARAYAQLRYSDAIQSFGADLHNAKSYKYDEPAHEREHLDELVAIMRTHGWTPAQFIDQLRAKWHGK